ncbi:ATP-binding cassette domain-containing protein [Idiomarina tyrosinivorans]|nr:ATP-binding cassette domain-containing protein [Idiomarina tyrosinivorans]
MFEWRNVTFYQAGQRWFQLPDLALAAGQVATVMGPSGSGKTSLLRWILGEPIDYARGEGELLLVGQPLKGLDANQRRVGLVQQQPLLFPLLTVADNIALGLRNEATKENRQQRITEALQEVGLADKLSAFPAQLSGGEKARVSLLRSLLNQPQLLLMDEPFSALDKARRQQVREWTYEQLARYQIPAILVTHDVDDRPSEPQQAGIFQLEQEY